MTFPPLPARGSAPTVRRAKVSDARSMAEITVRGWRAAYADILPRDFLAGLSIDGREMGWQDWLRHDADESPAWVAEDDGIAIGMVASGPPRDDDVPAPAAEVYAIYVAPDRWRRGAGRVLLLAATEEWTRRGATTLVLWVLEANHAGQAFYRAMGWRPDGSRQELELGGVRVPEVRYRLELASLAPAGSSSSNR